MGQKHFHRMTQFNIPSWNIEGLTHLQETEIVHYTSGFDVDVCCLQETRRCRPDASASNGFTFILSGGAQDETERYGVGFGLSKRFKSYVGGVCQVNERLASFKMGFLPLSSHSLLTIQGRSVRDGAFYEELADRHPQELLSLVADAGKLYGMELHWDEFQLLQLNCHSSTQTPTGERIEAKSGRD